MEEKSKHSEGFIISTQTQITELQALDLYKLLGDWDKVSEYAKISNIGASFKYLQAAIALDISADKAEILFKADKNN